MQLNLFETNLYTNTINMRLVLFIFCAALLLGCNKKVECDYNDCGFVAPASEIQAVKDYLSANSISAVQHCSGLFYKIEAQGTGNYPDGCSTVSAAYIGKLTNGSVFDQSATPIRFGLQEVIKGWTNGVPLIKEGGRIILYIPPSLGYGSRSAGSIPPNSILIFDIALADVE